MKKSVTVLSYVFEVLLIASIVGLALFIALNKQESEDLFTNIVSGVLMLTSMFGAYYLILGCKKGIASIFYVCFMGATAFCDLLALYNVAKLDAIFMAVSIAACTVLCFSKDLGQKKSYGFALAALVAKIVVFVFALINTGFSMNVTASIILAVVALFMVYAKYFDKAQRGSN